MEVKVDYQKGRRLRMFAGPNGSGKSTIYNTIKEKYDLGIYLNADDLEKELKQSQEIDLNNFGFDNIRSNELDIFISNHNLTSKAISEGFKIDLSLSENKIIHSGNDLNSYLSSLIIDFIRQKLLSEGKKISFETVMSHSSKIEVLQKSRDLGYKNYLYFIGTKSEKINLQRVAARVRLGGHNVNPEKIVSRYFNSLKLLKSAVQASYRSFIFDNSGDKPVLILEFEGEEYTFHTNEVPLWIDEYLLN